MRSELVLKKISLKHTEDYTEIDYEIALDNKEEVLWYRVAPEYGKYLCDDRADSFMVTFLPFALEHHFDLRSEYPVSKKLLFQLSTQVMPQLVLTSQGIDREIRIVAESTDEQYQNENGVGTGMSCGVDSFATLYEYTELCKDPEYKITHLTHFNVGAHHGQTGTNDTVLQRELYLKDAAMVQQFCDEYGYRLITVDSNLTEVLFRLFDDAPFERTHTYRNIGVVLSLQKLFSKYYYSPGYNIDHFNCGLGIDSALYERFLLPNFSTESLSLYSSNKGWSREDKIKQIVQFPQSYNWLKVCVKQGTNCCKCVKCMRTILGLEAIGKTDLYAKVFDPKVIEDNREHLKTYMLCQVKKGDAYHKEIYEEALKNGMRFSPKSEAYATLYRLSLKLLPRELYFKLKKKSTNNVLRVDLNESFGKDAVKRRKQNKINNGKTKRNGK